LVSETRSSLAPSPTAATTGSREAVHDGLGRKFAQSFGECWKSVMFPFESVTGTSTGVFDVDLYCTRNVPAASRYFWVGQTNV
jgi:hypothetical protein